MHTKLINKHILTISGWKPQTINRPGRTSLDRQVPECSHVEIIRLTGGHNFTHPSELSARST